MLILLPHKGFLSKTPTPSEIPIISFRHFFIFFGFTEPPPPQEINIFLNCTIVKSVLPCTPVVSVLFFPLRFSYIVHLGKYELQCSHENHQLEYALFV